MPYIDEVWYQPDIVEDMEVEPDEDGLYLRLQGDFTNSFEAYLRDDNSISISLKISPDTLSAFIRGVRRDFEIG